MSKKDTIKDIPFYEMASSHYMPWIMALLMFLLTVVLLCTFSVSGSVFELLHSSSNKYTIEIPNTQDPNKNQNISLLEQAHGIIDKLPDIESVQEVTSERMIELIRPWIGPVETLADLQLPILIDVTFKPTAKVDLESLQNQLREISAGARVEPVNKWQNHVNIVSQSVKLFAYLIMAFIFCAIAIMVVLITKSSLTAYQGIINTLSLIGAHNMYLAKQFQNQAFMIAVKGSIIGMIFAVPAVAFFAWFTHYFDIPFVLRKPPSISGMFMIILMPLTVSALCMLVTRWTVLRTLVRLNK